MHKLKLLIFALAGVALFSCEPTYEKQYSWAYPVAGDWMVTTYVDGEATTGPWEMKSYNSSYGKDSIWIDDYEGNFWTFQTKCAVDMNSKTFQTTGSISAIEDYPITVKVLNGKIIGKDSIYMELQFEDEGYYDDNDEFVPTPFAVTYQVKGHREVSYEEYTKQ